MAEKLSASNLLFFGLDKFDVQGAAQIAVENGVTNDPGVSKIFEFKFESFGELAFTGISVDGVIRRDNSRQKQFVSVVDTSDEGVKESLIFCGDLLNFHLGGSVDLQSETLKADDLTEDLCNAYFECVSNLRGFPPNQKLLCSSDASTMESIFTLAKSLMPENYQLLEQETEQVRTIRFLGEHRMLQPMLNTSAFRVKRAVELLNLNPEYPPHVLKVLWALRNQINES